MNPLKEIQSKIAQNMQFLKETFHVKELGVFGSTVRGEETAQSDVDILVEFAAPIGFFDFIRLEDFLSTLVGKKVDLVCKKALKAVIKDEILKEVSYV
jgi:predicted nucleotidyltransferase